MNTSNIEIFKWFENLARKYYGTHDGMERFEGDEHKYYALQKFLWCWAYERAGAPFGYRVAAIKTISYLHGEHISLTKMREEYLKFYTGKTNERMNPILDPRLAEIDFGQIVADLRAAKIKEAFDALNCNGFGHKIKSFFLRDLIAATNSEDKIGQCIENYLYAQPIDIWVRETMKAIQETMPMPSAMPVNLKHAGLGMSKEDFNIAAQVINCCHYAGVSPLRVNQGMWFFGSRVVADAGRLKSLLKENDVRVLEKELDLIHEFLKPVNDVA